MRMDTQVLGADCSGAINGDRIALARAPRSSRGTPAEPAKARRVPSPWHPGPPGTPAGRCCPPVALGENHSPVPPQRCGNWMLGGVLGGSWVSRHWGHFSEAGAGLFLPTATLFLPKTEDAWAVCNDATSSHFAPSKIGARSQDPGSPPC